MIYAGTRGYVVAIDEKSRQEKWRVKLSTGNFMNVAGYGDVSVLVREGIVIVGCNGHAWGLDGRNGDVLWHNGLSGLGNSVVALADDKSSIQYIHTRTTANS